VRLPPALKWALLVGGATLLAAQFMPSRRATASDASATAVQDLTREIARLRQSTEAATKELDRLKDASAAATKQMEKLEGATEKATGEMGRLRDALRDCKR
jgi:ABC-type transporter Mla subunit MlaD